MDSHKLKATDLVVESLKLIVTISTLFFAAILAYRVNVQSPVVIWSFYISLIALAISAIFSILNIHSLINKIYRDEADAIMQREAKALNIIAISTLAIGISCAALFISKNSSAIKGKQNLGNPKLAVISDSQIVIGSEVKLKIHVTKGPSGHIKDIQVEP